MNNNTMEELRQQILDNIEKSVASKKIELENLELDAKEIAARLKDALDAKDLSENSAYDIAQAETKRNNKQIALVRAFIESYDEFKKIVSTKMSNTYIGIGSTIKIVDLETKEEFVYMMVKDSLADGGAGALSELSYPGRVLMGKTKNAEVLVRTSVMSYKCKVLEVY